MCHPLTTEDILNVFTDRIELLSGRVLEAVDNGSTLYARALLPQVDEVLPGDKMQGGLALRANDCEISLHPFLLREVCRNGAIIVRAIDSFQVDYSEWETEFSVMQSLQDAISACSDPNVFEKNMDCVRASLDLRLDSLALLMSRFPRIPSRVMREISRSMNTQESISHYAVMNLITALARDTPDQKERWRLEELGGAIGAVLSPEPFGDPRGLARDPRGFVVS